MSVQQFKALIRLRHMVALCVSLIGTTAFAEDLTAEKYRSLLKELQPSKDALWRTIPWKTSLLDAQKQAVAESKPIFIWAMDGHPLGCT